MVDRSTYDIPLILGDVQCDSLIEVLIRCLIRLSVERGGGGCGEKHYSYVGLCFSSISIIQGALVNWLFSMG